MAKVKAPAYQHYVKDWIADLSEHPLEIEGAWIAFCSRAWLSDERGVLSKTLPQWAAIWRTSPENALEILRYIEREKIGDVFPSVRDTSRESHARVTVSSRRMVREEKERKSSRLRQQRKRGRDASQESNGNVTPPSSSASAFAGQNTMSGKPDGDPPPPKEKGPQIPFKKIIEYLNDQAGKSFSPDTKETRRMIRARWNAGFRLEDFKAVIDRKVAQWSTDEKMVEFIRPQTLFGTKFEAYLNQGKARRAGPGPVSVCRDCGASGLIIDGLCEKCRAEYEKILEQRRDDEN